METPVTATDIQTFDDDIDTTLAEAMIETVWADVVLVAPCIKEESFGDDQPEYLIKVKSIVRAVVLRWADAGSGGVRQRAAGDFSEILDKDSAGGKLRPGEIRELQDLCSSQQRRKGGRASTIPTGLFEFLPPPAEHPFLSDTEWYWQ
jgi:hypothetical protein